MRRRFLYLLTAALVAAGVYAAPPAATEEPDPVNLVDLVPALDDLAFPPLLAALPAGRPNGPLRNYGTPTTAPGKTCPFVGNVPVSVPTVTSPVGTSLPGLGGLILGAGSFDSYVHAELCMSEETLAEARAGNPPAVLVMVHGITYGTWYFDFPYKPGTYSTVNYLNRHGYATLNFDRIGYGRSAHPLSLLTTASANAEVVHQLVQKLKAGKIGPSRFPHVGVVGHSYGTVTTWLESSIYDDVDVNIGTGYSDRVSALSAGGFISLSTPAAASPLNREQPWAIDPGYLQPLPTARSLPQLYYGPNVDPEVIATDVELANTVTFGEIATFVPPEYSGQHKNITVPTFSIQGEFDIMTCGQNAAECTTNATHSDNPVELEQKGARYTAWQAQGMNSQSCFRGAVVPDTAHDIQLHRNATQFHAQVAFFADQAMGTHGQNAAHYKATCAEHGPTVFDSLPELTRLVPLFPTNPPPLEPTVNGLLDYLYPR